jgi:hypothetical protein
VGIFFALSEVAGHEVPGWVTGFYLLVLLAMVLCLAFEEKIHAKKIADRRYIRRFLPRD